jgi:hypothetical protein
MQKTTALRDKGRSFFDENGGENDKNGGEVLID